MTRYSYLALCTLMICMVTSCNDDETSNNALLPTTNPGQDTDSSPGWKSDLPSPTPNNLIVLTPTKGLMTSEDGTATAFQVALKNPPSSEVILSVDGTPISEGAVFPSTLIFTPQNYSIPQDVIVSGVDDTILDGNQVFIIQIKATSADPAYQGMLNLAEIVNVDNEVNTAFPHANTLHYLVDANGLETDEFGTRSYLEFQLPNRPAYDVVVTLESTTPNEAVPERSKIVIEPDHWDQISEVPVIGIADNIADGDQRFKIKIVDIQSDDPSINEQPYDFSNNMFKSEVDGINRDVDGKTLNKLVVNAPAGNPFSKRRDLTYAATVSENGDFVTMQVGLDAPPKNGANAYVIAVVSDPSEGRVEPPVFSFDQSNWNQKHEFKVYGVDDDEPDGDVAFSVTFVTVSDDLASNELKTESIIFLNKDNDTTEEPEFKYAVLVESEEDSICHTYNDKGIGSTIYVALNHQPTEPVTVKFNLFNPEVAYIASVDQEDNPISSIEFTPLNWNIMQKIQVIGQNIPNLNQDYEYYIEFETKSNDKHFDKLPPAKFYCTHHAAQVDPSLNITQSLDIINFSGIDLNTPNVIMDEEVRTFYVSLSVKPKSEVSFEFTQLTPGQFVFCDKTGGQNDAAYRITFTPNNFNTPQPVYLRKKPDRIVQENTIAYIRSRHISNISPNIDNIKIPFIYHSTQHYKPEEEEENLWDYDNDHSYLWDWDIDHSSHDDDHNDKDLPGVISNPDICSTYGILYADSKIKLRYAFRLDSSPSWLDGKGKHHTAKILFTIPEEYRNYVMFGNSKSEYYLTFDSTDYDIPQYLEIKAKNASVTIPALIPITYTFSQPEKAPLDVCTLLVQYLPAKNDDSSSQGGGASQSSDDIILPKDGTRQLRIMSANTTSGDDQMYEQAGMNMFYAMDPDIIIVQEFTPSAQYVVQNLKNYFNTDYSYHAGDGRLGNGIIVKGDLKILKTYSMASVVPKISDRKYEAAVIDIPGDKDLLVVSLHLYTKAYQGRTSQIDEYPAVANFIHSILNDGNYYVVVGGDFNSSTNYYVNYYWNSLLYTDAAYPHDQKNNFNTNRFRAKHLDWVLVDKEFQKFSIPTVIGSKTFPNGYVLDSQVHTPLSEIAPVCYDDSAEPNMQHMPVVRDFLIEY